MIALERVGIPGRAPWCQLGNTRDAGMEVPAMGTESETVEMSSRDEERDREYAANLEHADTANQYVQLLEALVSAGSIGDIDKETRKGLGFGKGWRDEYGFEDEMDCLDVLNDLALEMYATARLQHGETVIESVTIVWGTGGPHYETTIEESGRALSVCYGWFGSNRAERVSYVEDLAAYLFELEEGSL